MIAAFSFFLVGVVSTMLVARHYYSSAADDLRREAKDLRHYSVLMLRAMKRAGWVKIKKDREGKIIGLEIDSNFKLPRYSDAAGTTKLQTEKSI